jgi:hypothetical protein
MTETIRGFPHTRQASVVLINHLGNDNFVPIERSSAIKPFGLYGLATGRIII